MWNRHQPWGAPSPPHGNAGSPAPPAQLCTGDIAPPLGHLHDGPAQNTGPTRRCGPASSWSNLAHCKVPRPPRNTPHKEATSPEVGIHIPTSSRDLPAGCVLGGCSLPQGLPRYSDAVAPPNRSTSRRGGGFRAPRPWVSALSAAATHPQTVQVGPSNAPDHPTEGLDRGAGPSAGTPPPHPSGQPTGHWL